MSFKVKIRLAKVPSFTLKEYHEGQVKVYSKLTDLVFEALNSPSIREWLEAFAEKLGVEEVEIRLNRMPHHEAKLLPIELGKREIFRPIGTFGRSCKRRPFIEIYPSPHFIAKTRPNWRPSLRGEIINALTTIIHEMLHQAGVWDEGEVKRLTDLHYSHFKQTSMIKFDNDIKPLLRKWRKEMVKLGL